MIPSLTSFSHTYFLLLLICIHPTHLISGCTHASPSSLTSSVGVPLLRSDLGHGVKRGLKLGRGLRSEVITLLLHSVNRDNGWMFLFDNTAGLDAPLPLRPI